MKTFLLISCLSLVLIFTLSCIPKIAPEVKLPPKLPTLAEEVVFVEEPDAAKAIRMMEVGEMDLYAYGITDVELVRRIKTSPAMSHEISYGSTTELSFNPVGPTFPKTGKLNPFHVPAIREAVNWLIDRNYIVDEIYGGLAVPRYFPLTTAFPDYARLAHIARALEIQYGHDTAKAKAIISEEMKKLGAVLVDGKWHYGGEPVVLIFMIRPEDKRKAIGDYVATLLEDLGFVVDCQYKTAAEASPIWIGSDPAEGRWHIYTGAWLTTIVSRDQAGNFSFYYTPRGRPELLWQAYKPDPQLDEVADTLVRRDYRTLEEREQLMAKALRLSMKDSVRVWLVDSVDTWPHRANIAGAADLGGGVSGSYLWPYTLRFTDKEGGMVRFGSPSIMTEPWNPVAGTNWIYDMMIMRGTTESPNLPDPFTGLILPNRVKEAEVYVQEGLPVSKTLDWVSLTFVPSISVPQDAWIDWDPMSQRFLTVGEVHPEGLTARTKTVVHYVDDLYQRHWHDGSQTSLTDAILSLALSFDRDKKESALFDEAEVPSFETFMDYFRGAKIVQENPLITEVYSDLTYLDAEWIADSASGYFYTSVPWHMLAIGMLSESNHELAFSSSKADRLKVEWMNYLAGPSLAVLEKYRTKALSESFIPYQNTLGKYVTAEEARERYRLLGEWFQNKGHFWVSQGPFYVESVHPVQKTIVVRRYKEYLEPVQKWLAFTKPRIAEVKISGPTQVRVGADAEFQLEVSFEGKPYAVQDVDFVRFLLSGARGELVFTGDAQAVRDGVWRVVLSLEQTRRLEAGSGRLEVAVVPRVVSIPSFRSVTFTVLP